MHEEEVKDLVDQLLKADKIIAEQHLGWTWRFPDMVALQHVLGRHGGLGLGANAPAAESEEAHVGKRVGTAEAEANEIVDLEAARAKKVAGTKVRAVLKMLASEAGFMVNPQVQESLASMPTDDAEVSRAETMLKALGVKTEERLNTLVHYFFVEKRDEAVKFQSDMHDEAAEFEVSHEPIFPAYFAAYFRRISAVAPAYLGAYTCSPSAL
jgi:hypothetical protein